MSGFTYNLDLLNKEVKEVVDIFIDYYGEERIDVQTYEDIYYQILVWFPEVEIINEYKESTIIYDFYFIVIINTKGNFKNLKCIKTTFTEVQYVNNYVHSHATVYNRRTPTDYCKFCLGDSPLRDTSGILKIGSNKISWEIFCGQLDDISKVESLHGGPYYKISDLYNSHIDDYTIDLNYISSNNLALTDYGNVVVADFIRYFLSKNNCKFSYCGYYTNGEPLLDICIKINNLFIEWSYTQNEHVIKYITEKLIREVKIENNKIKVILENPNMFSIEEIPIVRFKQDLKYLKVIKEERSSHKMIKPELLIYIYLKILIILNNYEEHNTTKQLYL